jgi:UDP-N-acetylmuramoyl-tripeptide--D-alanyl-D-alanine ligase
VIRLDVDELRRLELGVLDGAGALTGVTIDSRGAGPGDLFVAVGAGVDYLSDARARGAATLAPTDAFAALAEIATLVRGRSDARVVAITGSTGKTSTKDILAALCAPHRRTVAAEASFNNELGIPLTLCRIEPETELCIVEIGMRGLGQIAAACAVVRPHIGVVTGVGPVHLELVGTVENVARAKAELANNLEPGGIAVVPDEWWLEPYWREGVELRRFGPANVRSFATTSMGAHVEIALDERVVELDVPFSARHQAQNLAAALLAYDALGLPLERAQEGASQIAFSRWRGEETELADGGLLVNDSYNANPVSTRAALQHLAARAGSRRTLAVLGTMAELGPDAPRFHEEIGALAAELGIDALLAVGEEARAYLAGANGGLETAWAPDAEAAAMLLTELRRPGDAILVKGSRSVGLELVASNIT